MKTSIRFFGQIITILSLSTTTLACPEFLLNFHTKFLNKVDICTAHDRYEKALNKLRVKKGFGNPERIENLMAPRFINLPDWQNRKTDLPLPHAYSIYAPAPTTWLKWDAGSQLIDQDAAKNFARERMPTLTPDWLRSVHGTSLSGLIVAAGRFRTVGEFGLMIAHRSALTMAQLTNATNVEYPTMADRTKKLVTFTPIECMEETPLEFRQEFSKQDRNHMTFDVTHWPHNAPLSFKTPDGEERQCGYFTYASLDEMIPQLSLWLHYMNKVTSNWGTQFSSADPVFVAARAQRWFVSIHPYEHGNGRMSRFIMDWVLESLGLPAPILKDQNDDLYSTEMQWAHEVGAGVLRAVSVAEHCASQPDSVGCDVIPLTHAGVLP